MIATERTLLRPFAPSDAEDLLTLFRDPGVRRYGKMGNTQVVKRMVPAVAIGGAAFGGFVAGALLLTLLDLYLAGHSIEPLGNRPLLDVDAFGVHLSVADSLALGLAVIAAMAAGLAIRWRRPR